MCRQCVWLSALPPLAFLVLWGVVGIEFLDEHVSVALVLLDHSVDESPIGQSTYVAVIDEEFHFKFA